jgi:hypothetical protein
MTGLILNNCKKQGNFQLKSILTRKKVYFPPPHETGLNHFQVNLFQTLLQSRNFGCHALPKMAI